MFGQIYRRIARAANASSGNETDRNWSYSETGEKIWNTSLAYT